jgi:ubiquinone/menaquinone biosynthesis C-methylase UbiE
VRECCQASVKPRIQPHAQADVRPLVCRAYPGSNGKGLKMLEVAGGTGRFATFVRDNYPAADLTVSDLSPFYLQEAASNLADWQRLRGARTPCASVDLVQCAAELLPFDTDSMDVVYSVYLFHEMPDDARDSALREMYRVLKPGGLLVMTDSAQWGDRPKIDDQFDLEAFKDLNEPHYPSYLQYDFGLKFQELGMCRGLKCLQSMTKSVSARKPVRPMC